MPKRKNELDFLLNVRKETQEMVPATDVIFRKSIQRAYPSLHRYVDVVRLQEIFRNEIPTKEILNDRQQGYYYADGRMFATSSRKKIEKMYNLCIEDVRASSDVRSIAGKCAYKGKVTGRVRRIYGLKQISDFKVGEILVAASTVPDFLPAMQKVAAIISDEGGLICHAAIVARELKKPCVIGTHIAMNTLKDGDIVEVNADQGIVRKLS